MEVQMAMVFVIQSKPQINTYLVMEKGIMHKGGQSYIHDAYAVVAVVCKKACLRQE